jgi:TPR repeat protein
MFKYLSLLMRSLAISILFMVRSLGGGSIQISHSIDETYEDTIFGIGLGSPDDIDLNITKNSTNKEFFVKRGIEILIQMIIVDESPLAADILSSYYFKIAKDPLKGVYWASIGAGLGGAQSMLNLGCAYFLGDGVESSEIEADMWFFLAATRGQPEAKELLKYPLVNFNKSKEMAEKWQETHPKAFTTPYGSDTRFKTE